MLNILKNILKKTTKKGVINLKDYEDPERLEQIWTDSVLALSAFDLDDDDFCLKESEKATKAVINLQDYEDPERLEQIWTDRRDAIAAISDSLHALAKCMVEDISGATSFPNCGDCKRREECETLAQSALTFLNAGKP